MEYETIVVDKREVLGQLENRIFNVRTGEFNNNFRFHSSLEIVKHFNKEGWNLVPYIQYPGFMFAMSRKIKESE